MLANSNRRMKTLGAATTVMLVAFLSAVQIQAGEAQSYAYLKIGGVEGETTARGHEGEINVLGWNWGTQMRAMSAQGDASSDEGMTSITVTKATDLASAPLHKLATGDKPIDEVTLTVRREGERDVQTLRLKGVTVTSVRDVGDGRENVVLRFERVEAKPATLH